MNFTTSYKVNEIGLILSSSELKSLYLYGLPIQERNGTEMADSTIETYIRSAQKQVENYLSLKLDRQIVEERLPFYRDVFEFYNYIQTTYPVRKGYRLQGWVANILQVEYPQEWLTARSTTDGETFARRMHLIPVGSTTGQIITFSGLMPYVGMRGRDYIPDFWKVAYSTGYDKVPEDILTVIGKLASIFILTQLGDIIMGAGVSNISLGLDGLSQSIGSTKSASTGAFGGRIQIYIKDIERELLALKDRYTGLVFAAL